MNQNEARQINATHNQQPRFETNCSFLTISLTGQLLAIPLLKGFIYFGISKMSFSF